MTEGQIAKGCIQLADGKPVSVGCEADGYALMKRFNGLNNGLSAQVRNEGGWTTVYVAARKQNENRNIANEICVKIFGVLWSDASEEQREHIKLYYHAQLYRSNREGH